jgi:hypothetical protein
MKRFVHQAFVGSGRGNPAIRAGTATGDVAVEKLEALVAIGSDPTT